MLLHHAVVNLLHKQFANFLTFYRYKLVVGVVLVELGTKEDAMNARIVPVQN